MSRVFSQIQPVAFKGQPIAQPISIYQPSRQPPAMVPVFVDWSKYNNAGAINTVGVSVDLSSGASGTPLVLDHIASITIDNSNSNVPIYVYFPDTQFTITCSPSSTIQASVVTGGRVAYIYGVGFTGGTQPKTQVCFFNTLLPGGTYDEIAYVQPQYLASTTNANIPNNTPQRSLALGDNVISYTLPLTTSGSPTAPGTITDGVLSVATAYQVPGCYIYFTSCTATIFGRFYRTTRSATEDTYGIFLFYDTLGTFVVNGFFPVFALGGTSITQPFTQELWRYENLQLKVRCDSGNSIRYGQDGQPAIFFNDGVNYLDYAYLRVQLAYAVRNEN